MMIAPWHVAVLIPARDEEKLLPRCLRSVLAACAALPRHVTSDIVVAVDCSRDSTRQIAAQMIAPAGAVVTTQAGMVGAARLLAAETALGRYSGAFDSCWLANTDADCCVPEDWLVQQLRLASDTTHAIAGIIDVDSFAEHSELVEQRFRDSYILSSDGHHPHVHGANLGVRADAYMRAGGWSPLETAEDHDLWQRLSNTGARRLSASGVKVLTSGRRSGRAPLGFAGALAAHNETVAC